MMLTRRYITVLSLGVLVLLVGFMLWTAAAQPAPLTITGQLGACDPSNSIASYEYQVVTLETGGDYTFTRVSADSSDIQMWLYIDSFTPSSPSTNVYAGDVASQTITLLPQNAPLSFVIVIYGMNGATGDWSASVTSASSGASMSLGESSINFGCPALSASGRIDTCDPSNLVGRYEYQVVTLEAGGDYTFTRVSADSSDIQMWLYIDSFTPSSASTNVYAGDVASQTIALLPQNAPLSFVIVMYVLNASDATGNWSASVTSSSGGSRASLGANSITTDCVETTPESTSEVTPEVTQPVVSVPEIMVTTAPDCPVVPPPDAVQGRMLVTAQAYFAPDETKDSPGILIPAGTAWWIMDASNGFYKLFIACKAELVWVKSSTMGANYDDVWHGAPLPS